MIVRHTLIFLFLCMSFCVQGQNATLSGKLTNEQNEPLKNATIEFGMALKKNVQTNASGSFSVSLPADHKISIRIRYVGYKEYRDTIILKAGEDHELQMQMTQKANVVTYTVKGDRNYDVHRNEVSTLNIDPKIPQYLPSATGDFNKLLPLIGLGVSSQSEFSSTYNVRGGNFEENLIYVNGIEVYRPFLVKNGQQEGLSFVNPFLVNDIEFSAGGWQPKYGDKLSSVLAIQYREPKSFKASANFSLLFNSVHVEGRNPNSRISYLIGVRQKSTRYLLNTLDVKGQYKPNFYDIQSYILFDFTHRRDSTDREQRTTLGWLTSYANNNYYVEPENQVTNFGTQQSPLRLEIGFEGTSTLNYATGQSALKLHHKFSERTDADISVSAVNTNEREYYDLEYGYRLCEISANPNSQNFNLCASVKGLGTYFYHGRNRLHANIYNMMHTGRHTINNKHNIKWGIGTGYEYLRDTLYEYDFSDSSGYVTLTGFTNSTALLQSLRTQAYLQHTFTPDTLQTLTYGVRLQHWTLNNQLLVSPRLQYAYKPNWKRDVYLKAAAGVYQQSPFYRELRNPSGVVNKNLKAQTSYHFILGLDYNFKSWDRKFKFITEAYFKYMTNIVPYYINNVMLRYYGYNNGNAYATGVDFRVSGEFVKGNESWFSLGFMHTQEDLADDNQGWINRPTDQRIIAAIYFQDHIPNNPSIKVYLNLTYASGLPFGPPQELQYRTAYRMPSYKRADIGFSKLVTLRDRDVHKKSFFESLWISLEVLNILGATNTISYYWVPDYSNNYYAVPNTLSQRFFNLRLMVKL